MCESGSLTELIGELRSKATEHEKKIAILSQDVIDLRIKRTIELLDKAAPAAEAICALLEEILQHCQDAPAFYRGYNLHLLLLHQDLTEAANYHSELSKRAHLYFQHMLNMGSSFSKDILRPIASAIAEQQQLADYLRFEGHQLLSTAVSRPPWPNPTIFNTKISTAGSQERQMRPLFENKPLPVDDQYDARWDPSCRVPGSQYVKFLRYPGPFFFPEKDEENSCDNFCLPESAGLIIDAWLSKYEAVKTNFQDTHRIPRRMEQTAIDSFTSHQKVSLLCETFSPSSLTSLLRGLAFLWQRHLGYLMILTPST